MNYKIKEVRLHRAMTQRELYEDLCSRRQYSRIENNHCQPSVYLLYHFAKLLKVNVEELIDEQSVKI